MGKFAFWTKENIIIFVIIFEYITVEHLEYDHFVPVTEVLLHFVKR